MFTRGYIICPSYSIHFYDLHRLMAIAGPSDPLHPTVILGYPRRLRYPKLLSSPPQKTSQNPITVTSWHILSVAMLHHGVCTYIIHIYIYIYANPPPPRPTFFVLGMSLAALSFFSSSHLLQHCIRKVACAHAPGHISPTYVAVA